MRNTGGYSSSPQFWLLIPLFPRSSRFKQMFATQTHTSPSPAERGRESPGRQTRAGFAPVDWSVLVAQIKAGDDAGMEHLYRLFSRGIRYYLCRQLGPQELEDKVHDTFLIVVHAIRKGDLREPERLMGFVRTVVRRQVAAYMTKRCKAAANKPIWNLGSLSLMSCTIRSSKPWSGKKRNS